MLHRMQQAGSQTGDPTHLEKAHGMSYNPGGTLKYPPIRGQHSLSYDQLSKVLLMYPM